MLEIRRTANAGVLLKLDGVEILLDGVSKEISPYLKTPIDIKKELCETFPDIVAFTHYHEDHYDEEYAIEYSKKTLRPIFGPELLISELWGNIKIYPVKTRHIGKSDVEHISYVISGSKTVWFLGDASPLDCEKLSRYQKPDVLIVPFAYALSQSGLKIAENTGAEKIVILHMPKKDNDPYNIWDEVMKNIGNNENVFIPEIDEKFMIV